jgi:HSP20 family protein
MSFVSHDPWSAMSRFQEEINHLVNNRWLGASNGDNASIATSQWIPAVDITEEHDHYILVADVPGVAPESIEITMDDGVLTLKGERKEERATNASSVNRLERIHGSFSRRFALPDGVDPERIVARGENGVLEITIPKVEKAKPRRIEIQH